MFYVKSKYVLLESKQPIDHSGGLINEKIQSQIQEHFEHEISVKKKIYDIEEQLDVTGQQIYRSLTDLKKSDDKPIRDIYESFKQAQKDMVSKLHTLQTEYNNLYARRNILIQEINGERRESMTYLMSIFKQYQFMLVGY